MICFLQMNKCYYYHFLIIPTKNPQFKKNRISYSALPNQSSNLAPGGVKLDNWLGKAESEIWFFLNCATPFGILKLKWAQHVQFLSYILQIFRKSVSFDDSQMILVPYFAISYGFNFGKNAKAFQSILEQSLVNLMMQTLQFY